MNTLITKLHWVNLWFDRLPEPTRFLLFLSCVSLAILPLQLGQWFQYKVLTALGICVLSFLVALATMRAFGRQRGGLALALLMLGLFAAIVLAVK